MKFTSAEALYRKADGKRNGLPAWSYNNAELTQLEMEQVFLRNWIWVGHVSEIPNAGDYRCLDIANERAVVVRDKNATVRAFHNMCSHRGSRVAVGEKGHCGNALICPFHGWSYNLDGGIKNIPKANAFPNIDKHKLGLKPLDCEVWHGLIFIRFAGEGLTIAETYAEAEKEIAMYRIEDMQTYDEPWRFDFELDWKSIVDIDNEGYHLPKGHPELFDLVGSSYRDEVLECGLSRSQGTIRGRKAKMPLIQNYIEALSESSYLPDSHRNLWIYWGMFPGVVISLFPDLVEVYQVYPTGYQKSVMAGACYALPDEREQMQKARSFNRKINMAVGDEDVQLVKWAAEGMRSSAFNQVLLSDLELGICSFQNQLGELLPVVKLEQEPNSGHLCQQNDRLLKQQKLINEA